MKLLESPVYINWNYTYRCNFNCKHCYSRSRNYPDELSSEDYIAIAKKIISARVFQVNLGGGEPVLRKDIFKIIKILSSRGVKVNLTTNGWLIDDKLLKKLKKVGLSTLFVSLDNTEPAEHDDFRNKKGSYVRAINCIKLAVKNGLEVILSTVVTKKNFSKMEDLVRFAEKEGVKGIDFKRFRPQGNGVLVAADYMIQSDSNKKLIDKIEYLKKNSSIKIFFLYSENGIEGLDDGCPCGRKSLALLPNGDLAPCVYNQYVIGNLLNSDLSKIWQESPFLLKLRNNFKCVANLISEEKNGK